MKKSKKEKLEKEIEYWSKHLELDKFNYNVTFSAFIGNLSISIAVIMSVVLAIMNYDKISSLLSSIIILVIGICAYLFLKYKIIKTYKRDLDQHKLSFFVRERMIQERYEKLNLGISKDKLNQEFADIKNICQNPTDVTRENSIKEYYKNKRLS